jgi:lipopolysaccharide/colanic/teichoic acid biosynthesis glycosyltransferase
MTSEESVPEFLTIREPRPGAVAADADDITARPALRPSAGAVRRIVIARHGLLPAADTMALSAAVLLNGPGWPGGAYSLAVLLVMTLSRLHRLRLCLRMSDQMLQIAAAALWPAPLLALWLGSISRALWIALVTIAFLTLARSACYAGLRAGRRHGLLTLPALIVGTGGPAAEIAAALTDRGEFGLLPVGFLGLDDTAADGGSPAFDLVNEIAVMASQFRSCCVIASLPDDRGSRLVSALRASACLLHAEVYVVPTFFDVPALVPAAVTDEIWGIPLVRLRRRPARLGCAAKRAFDIAAAAILLVVLTPLLLAIAGGVLLVDGRPLLFRQLRLTRHGKVMTITKLRTVASTASDTQWRAPASTSRLRHWLRATHLDELPQLVQVVRGDMSLVGPRPERPYFAAHFSEQIPGYDDRHRVRAGMTGWAQVHGLVGDTSIPERVRFDNYYIDHWSLWLDAVILIRTVAAPVAGIRRQRRGFPEQEAGESAAAAAKTGPDPGAEAGLAP